MAANILGDNVINHEGDKIDVKQHLKGKVVGLYFSAHWCGPCRGFTPILAEYYKKVHEEKNFEIIFVSSDQDEKAFTDYFKSMPWLALKFSETGLNEKLNEDYQVQGIPTLVLIDADSGELLQADARVPIQFKKELIDQFPWKGMNFDE